MNLLTKSYVIAPVSVLLYGVTRLLDGLDGERGPGLAWTAGHLAFLAGLLAIAVVIVRLRRMSVDRPRTAGVVAALGLVGVAASVVQAGIDLFAGFVAADHDEMGAIFDQVQSVPGVEPLIYTVVPQFFFVSVVVLVALQAAARRVQWWSPVLALAGLIATALSLDLLPVTAVLLGVALAPFARDERRVALAA